MIKCVLGVPTFLLIHLHLVRARSPQGLKTASELFKGSGEAEGVAQLEECPPSMHQSSTPGPYQQDVMATPVTPAQTRQRRENQKVKVTFSYTAY